jgi:hypothetical protein
MRSTTTTTTLYDAESDIAAWVVGSGIVLLQVCALIPGLLPVLLLLVPLVIPLIVLGAVAGLLVALPVGAWRAVRWAFRAGRRRPPRRLTVSPKPRLLEGVAHVPHPRGHS